MILKKLRNFLIAVAVAGLLIDGGYWAYCRFAADIASSKIVSEIGGD